MKSDLMLCLGSTLAVTPACTLVAHAKTCAIVNRQTTDYDERASVRVFGDCDRFMQQVMQLLLGVEEEARWRVSIRQKLPAYDRARAP